MNYKGILTTGLLALGLVGCSASRNAVLPENQINAKNGKVAYVGHFHDLHNFAGATYGAGSKREFELKLDVQGADMGAVGVLQTFQTSLTGQATGYANSAGCGHCPGGKAEEPRKPVVTQSRARKPAAAPPQCVPRTCPDQ